MQKVNLEKLASYEKAASDNKIHTSDDLLKVNDIIIETNNNCFEKIVRECVLQ